MRLYVPSQAQNGQSVQYNVPDETHAKQEKRQQNN